MRKPSILRALPLRSHHRTFGASSKLSTLLATLFLVSLSTTLSWAQPPPSTDVYLVEIRQAGDQVALGEVENLTDREGYDNQPSFSVDGRHLYYTSEREGQTDIWAIDTKSGGSRAITQTPESEYSPTPIPAAAAISVVRVEEDGTQRLWRFPSDGSAPSLVLEKVKPVGYHAWIDQELVLFVLGEPHVLVRVDGSDAKAEGRVLAKDIGRALHPIPGEDAFSFVHKGEDGAWHLKRLDRRTDEIRSLVAMRGEAEDLTWSPDGWAWMADGNEIYRFSPAIPEGWQSVGKIEGVGSITRLAIDPDGGRLAFVAQRLAAEESR